MMTFSQAAFVMLGIYWLIVAAISQDRKKDISMIVGTVLFMVGAHYL